MSRFRRMTLALCCVVSVCAQSSMAQESRPARRPSGAPELLPDPSITPIQNSALSSQRQISSSDRARRAIQNSDGSDEAFRPKSTRVREGGALSTDAGQFWREYDIQTYVRKVESKDNPQQTIVDWILRETGTDTWFHQGGVLNADRKKISVYHSAQVQERVAQIIDRFTNTESQRQAVAVRLCTLDRPDWRKAAWRYMTPIAVKSQGIEAWLMSKEASALLLAQLRARPDFRELNSPNLMIRSGHSHTIERFLPRNYVQGVDTRAVNRYGYGLKTGQVQEGYSLQISPLATIGGENIEAVVKCSVDQIERMTPLPLDIPSAAGQQKVRAQVPQISSWRIHERFRWPRDQVLVISRGVVAMPGLRPESRVPGLGAIVKGAAPRADALLFLEAENLVSDGLADRRTDFRSGQLNYRGRY